MGVTNNSVRSVAVGLVAPGRFGLNLWLSKAPTSSPCRTLAFVIPS